MSPTRLRISLAISPPMAGKHLQGAAARIPASVQLSSAPNSWIRRAHHALDCCRRAQVEVDPWFPAMEVWPLNEMKEAPESGLMLLTVLVSVAVLRSNSQKECTDCAFFCVRFKGLNHSTAGTEGRSVCNDIFPLSSEASKYTTTYKKVNNRYVRISCHRL